MAGQGTASPEGTSSGIRVAADMYVREVELSELKEQDINARVMGGREFERLVENIKARGALESMIYCAQPGGTGQTEIVSGHHRYRAAGVAGMKTVWILVDTSKMTRSQLVAKQLAHNALAGADDPDVIKQLVGFIDNPDDMLASGLTEAELMGERDKLQLFAPHVDFDTKTITFSFLPHQADEIETLVESIKGRHDLIIAGESDQFENFLRAAGAFAGIKRVLSGASAIALLTRVAQEEVDRFIAEQDDGAQAA